MREKFSVQNFDLYYSTDDNGGGTSIGLDFKNILSKHYNNRKFDNCLEWCSGPGFIGFDLLLNNFCSRLSLIDKHQSALTSATDSVSSFGKHLPVKTYCLDSIANLPITEKFDLIVANPPHFSFPIFHQEHVFKNNHRIYLDTNWQIHKDFFENISKHLADDGIILLQESSWGCNYNTFDHFLIELVRTNHYETVTTVLDYPIFYIEYKLK
jgi:methylase of polypeptide subunit release factors